MKKRNVKTMAVALATLTVALGSCNVNMPKEVPSSFETMTVKKSDIEVPYKFSARMKGQNDVTITPQVSGQLMKIAVSEGQQVKKGQVLFVIDSRNAQLELEAAQANLQAALAQENSAKLEYESNKNLFEKKIEDCEQLYAEQQRKLLQTGASLCVPGPCSRKPCEGEPRFLHHHGIRTRYYRRNSCTYW